MFVLSIKAFDKLLSMAASMPAMFFLIFLPSSTKASMRQRWAQNSDAPGSRNALGGLLASGFGGPAECLFGWRWWTLRVVP